MSKSSGMEELEDRDPNSLSKHLQVSWEDVIGEPSSLRSPECAYRVSYQCFQTSRSFCYILLSVLLAPVFALCMGCTFACIAFEHIWCVTPCLRIWKISCAATRNFVLSFTQAVIIPVADAIGQCWAHIKVKTQKMPEGLETKNDFLVV